MKRGRYIISAGNTGRDGFGDEAGDFGSAPSVAHAAASHRDPEWVLAAVSERVHTAVEDLDNLMFEVRDVGARSRTHIHEAVALLMEAVQALDKAQVALPRAAEARLAGLSGRMARA